MIFNYSAAIFRY